MSVFALSTFDEQKVEVVCIGVGRHPVLIVDNYYQDPEAVRAAALRSTFEATRQSYPGHVTCADVSPATMLEFLNRFAAPPLVAQPLRPVQFSVFKRERLDLTKFMVCPHTDYQADLIAVVYLNEPSQCSGGTSFYRHVGTRLERFPNPDNPIDVAGTLAFSDEPTLYELAKRLRETDVPEGEYIQDSTCYWDLLYLAEMRFNRLIAYDPRLFHSLYIEPERFVGTANEDRRLTQNFAASATTAFWRFAPTLPGQ